MLYTKEITFTSGGTVLNQISSNIKASRGVIHKIDIVFPSGCAGLVKVAIFLGIAPISPSTAGMTISGNAEIVQIPEFIDLRKDFNIITIKGFNEDDTYNHTILFRIYVLPKEVLLPAGATEGILAGLKSLVLRPIVISKKDEKRE